MTYGLRNIKDEEIGEVSDKLDEFLNTIPNDKSLNYGFVMVYDNILEVTVTLF